MTPGPRIVTRHRSAGFTMVEMLITITVLAAVMAVVMAVMTMTSRSKVSSSNAIESTQAARVGLEMMARDLRTAGYGADLSYPGTPQPAIAYIDSMQVLLCADLSGAFAGARDTTAYDPAGSPRPYPLNGTPWAPAVKYRTGAEIIRWTLDVNNDGVVNASDVASTNGVDAQRTPNPNDYVLVRQVYGDSLNDVAGDNGGAVQRIALVNRPGDPGVPAMFRVYMKGQSTPWDWSNGPVPANRLSDIQRIGLTVVSSSARPDWRGNFTQTRLTTTVNSLRNIPDWGATQYTVDGWVFNDANTNNHRELGETGLSGVTVHLGPLSATTDATGYFVFQVGSGTYTLKQDPPSGYAPVIAPDSTVVTVPPSFTHDFPDSLRHGGWLNVNVYNDANVNGAKNAGENGLANVKVTNTVTGQWTTTDASGNATLFSTVGAWTVNATPPDSFYATSPNPVSGTMADGGSASVSIGLGKNGIAVVKGTVFKDTNKNRAFDSGEAGVPNVWVGVSPDGGLTIEGYATTDASGNYSITVPANSPPGTNPYAIYIIVPGGWFATTTTSINNVLLTNGQSLNNQNFGIVNYQIINLSAQRVLSLASADLIEQDWSGSANSWATKSHRDADLILGSDAGGTDQISVWFNQYNSATLFNSTADYTRSAAQSVLCLAADTLDSADPVARYDIVTGTKKAATGNFAVWIDQNSSGNLGFFPATPTASYTTQDGGDVQAVVTLDCAGGAYPDIIVGTKSPTLGQGTIEVWQNGEGATPAFTRQEIYPPNGSLPVTLGEVTSMALGDVDGDGLKDLVVGTHVSDYSGQIVVLRNIGRTNGLRFMYATGFTLGTAAVTSLALADVDGDGKLDIVAGVQTGLAAGKLVYYHNNTVLTPSFSLQQARDVSGGFPIAVAAGDMGGATRNDIIVGWRQNTTSFAGGVLVYYTDSGSLPSSGVDPSGGSLQFMVPALTINNFNYGVQPSLPSPPYLMDFAAGVKTGTTSGAIVVFIR